MKASRLLCLVLASGAVCAAPETANDAPPSAELLEFLGEWQTKNGQPVDPFDLQENERTDAASKPVEDKKHD